MRVLLVGRPQLAIRGGGDKVAILKTQEYLNRLGVEAYVTYDIRPDYRGFDIAHLFTLSTWHAAKRAREYGIPFIVSTIYWSSSRAEEWILNQKPILTKLLRRLLSANYHFWNFINFIRSLLRLSQGDLFKIPKALHVSWASYQINDKKRHQVLQWASYLVPPSQKEMNHIEEKFEGAYPYIVVPHGVEPWFLQGNAEEFINRYGIKDFILCVSATFGYRKNQLSLIKALKGTGLPVVIIAGVNSRAEKAYFKQCQLEADPSFYFIPVMPREKLASVYKAAKVFALPSLFETPGLVYLEAALAGCNVVATEEGSAREYLGEYAWYCNPYDIRSIRQSVFQAYSTPKGDSLKQHVFKNFTWKRAAELTLSVYKKVLSRRP